MKPVNALTPDNFFVELKENVVDINSAYSTFVLRNPTPLTLTVNASRLNFYIKNNATPTYSMNIYRLKNISYSQNITDFSTSCKPYKYTAPNSTNFTNPNCTQIVTGWHWNNYTLEEFRPLGLETINPYENVTIKVEVTYQAKMGKNFRDWIPFINVSGIRYEKSEWQWWNTSYINCRNITHQLNSDHPTNARTVNFEPVEYNFTNIVCSATNCQDIRIVNNSCNVNGATASVPFSVISNTSTSALVVWEANLTSNNTNYSIYYNNPTAEASNFADSRFNANIKGGVGYNITNKYMMMYNDSASEADTDDWYFSNRSTWATNWIIGTNNGWFPYDVDTWGLSSGTIRNGNLYQNTSIKKVWRFNVSLTGTPTGQSNVTLTWYRDTNWWIYEINNTYTSTENGARRTASAFNGVRPKNNLWNLTSTYVQNKRTSTADSDITMVANTTNLFACGVNETNAFIGYGYLSHLANFNGGGFDCSINGGAWGNTGSNTEMGMWTTLPNVASGSTLNATFMMMFDNVTQNVNVFNNTWAMLRNPPTLSIGTQETSVEGNIYNATFNVNSKGSLNNYLGEFNFVRFSNINSKQQMNFSKVATVTRFNNINSKQKMDLFRAIILQTFFNMVEKGSNQFVETFSINRFSNINSKGNLNFIRLVSLTDFFNPKSKGSADFSKAFDFIRFSNSASKGSVDFNRIISLSRILNINEKQLMQFIGELPFTIFERMFNVPAEMLFNFLVYIKVWKEARPYDVCSVLEQIGESRAYLCVYDTGEWKILIRGV